MRRITRSVLVFLAIIFLIEAWLWDRLEPIVARLIALIPLVRLKAMLARWIAALSPVATLALLALPAALVLPLKMLAVLADGERGVDGRRRRVRVRQIGGNRHNSLRI
jgi:hypothetical protein